MDGYVKRFIAASIFYLIVASILGVVMLAHPATLGTLKFPHSHLMLLGWVSMMIFGVGYHILPRFAGRLITQKKLPEFHFIIANAGLIGMTAFYTLAQSANNPRPFALLTALSGVIEMLSFFIFFYLMMTTVYKKADAPQGS